ncbi:MAG: SDR family NAD(P)-dependent oxidoreductase [Oxalobacteraceae bacterium]
MSKKPLTVVTGGASGIGAACVRHHVKRGDTVIVLDLPTAWSDAKANDLGVTAFYACDVLEDQRVRDLADIIEKEHGPIDCLINSAGILQRKLPPEQLPMDHWDAVTNIDLRGTYLCCAVFGARMAARGHGAIVNIASITSFRSSPLHAYGPAKAAVASLTMGLAAEWGRSGVRVNAVAPGFTLTEGLQAAIDRGDRDPAELAQPSAMNRLVMPDEVADGIGFLLSDAARAITGITMPIDCGWMAGSTWDTWGGMQGPRPRQA